MVLSLIGREDEKTDVKMFTKNPIFRQSFALLIGNPESDDLYINVYDAGPEQDINKRKRIGSLKIIVSRILRRSNVRLFVFCMPSFFRNYVCKSILD